jgi:hypothetical protein
MQTSVAVHIVPLVQGGTVDVRMSNDIMTNDNSAQKQEKPHNFRYGALFKIGHRPTLPRFTAVPSALAGLTSLFGMGRGGHRRYRHLKIFNVKWLIGLRG